MKITKQQLKQLIKEELLKEDDWYDLETDTPPSHVQDSPETAITDVEAERALMGAIDSLTALEYSREDIMDLVTDLVDTSSQGKPEDPDAEWMDAEASDRQDHWPPDKDEEEEEEAALNLKTPTRQSIARLKRSSDVYSGKTKPFKSPGDFRK